MFKVNRHETSMNSSHIVMTPQKVKRKKRNLPCRINQHHYYFKNLDMFIPCEAYLCKSEKPTCNSNPTTLICLLTTAANNALQSTLAWRNGFEDWSKILSIALASTPCCQHMEHCHLIIKYMKSFALLFCTHEELHLPHQQI